MKIFAALLCSLLLFETAPVRASGSSDDGPSSPAPAVASAVIRVAAVATPAPVPATVPAPVRPVSPPRIVHFQTPSYPEIAWQSQVQGKVSLKVLVYKDGRFDFTGAVEGNPLLVAAAKENLCSWNFAPNDSADPLPLTVEFEYRIDKVRTSAQLTTQVTYDLPNRVTVVAPAYAPSCLCIKKKSKWHLLGR